MSLFTQSVRAVTAIQRDIADTIGASADDQMIGRAGLSLEAAVKHFNNKARWEFALDEADAVSLVAPFGMTLTASAGQASASSDGHSLQIHDIIQGSGFVLGTRVSATSTNGFGFTRAITGYSAGLTEVSATATRDRYDLPSDYKSIYSVRLLGQQVMLRPARRRLWDRTTTDELNASTPTHYDLLPIGERGKIGILPPPAASDTMIVRYYRRMTVVTSTAAATTTLLDIPQDYEEYLIAWAKWHFLVDKGEGRKEQATTWFNLANEGLMAMKNDQTKIPDEDLAFIPGHTMTYQSVDSVAPRWPDEE